MTEVAIDASFLLTNRASGLKTYTRHFVEALLAQAPHLRCVLWYNVSRGTLWRPPTLPHWRAGTPRQVLCRIPRRLLEGSWRRLGAPPLERFLGPVDVFHSVHVQVPPRSRARCVLTVHDLREFRLPHLYGWLQGERRRRGADARRADHIIAVSEATRRDAIECLGVDPARVTVAHNGLDAAWLAPLDPAAIEALRARLGLRRPYLLTLSSLDPRKDVETALRAGELLRQRHGWDGELVVAGAARAPEVGAGAARWLGMVTDEDMRALMAGAELLLFPSLYEGFGFPVLEAMAAGTPVVACDTSSIPEVAGDAAVLVPPGDAEAFAEGARGLLSSAGERASRVARGRLQAARFTWEAHAAVVAAVYCSLA